MQMRRDIGWSEFSDNPVSTAVQVAHSSTERFGLLVDTILEAENMTNDCHTLDGTSAHQETRSMQADGYDSRSLNRGEP